MEQPVGIIKTMPESWVKALPDGVDGWERDFMRKCNTRENYYWRFSLCAKPRYDVLYFYILFQGAIRYRANIISYDGPGDVKCYTGEMFSAQEWVCVGAPVIKLKEPVPMKGFRGFRYAMEMY
jgi:hypothetical protein